MLALSHSGPLAQAWLFAVFCDCKHQQLLGCMPWVKATVAVMCWTIHVVWVCKG